MLDYNFQSICCRSLPPQTGQIFWILHSCVLVDLTVRLNSPILQRRLGPGFYRYLCPTIAKNIRASSIAFGKMSKTFNYCFLLISLADPFKKDECQSWCELWGIGSLNRWLQWCSVEGRLCRGRHVSPSTGCHRGLFPFILSSSLLLFILILSWFSHRFLFEMCCNDPIYI